MYEFIQHGDIAICDATPNIVDLTPAVREMGSTDLNGTVLLSLRCSVSRYNALGEARSQS